MCLPNITLLRSRIEDPVPQWKLSDWTFRRASGGTITHARDLMLEATDALAPYPLRRQAPRVSQRHLAFFERAALRGLAA
jgi:hypothetical protein